MYHKIPIRTYERKRHKELVISLERIHVPTIHNVRNKNHISFKEDSSTIEIKEANDNSMYHDPFETTFDRLVKNAKAKGQAPKTHKKEIYSNNSSIYDSSTSKIANSKHSLHDDLKLPDISIKSVSKPKTLHKKAKMQVVKKTIDKKQKGKSQVKKNKSFKKYELRKTRNKKKKAPADISSDSLRVCNIENQNDVCNIVEVNGTNEKYVSRNKESYNGQDFNFFKGLMLKSCSVVLDGSNVLGWKNKRSNIEIDSLEETQRSISENYETSKDTKIIIPSINGLKYDNVNTKHCFVKIEQLGITSNAKSFALNKNYNNVISSTPIGRPIRSVSHLIPVSPIPIGYSEKLNGLVTYIDNNSVTANSSKELHLSESKQVHIELCEKSDLLEEYTCNENTNYSKCSSNKSKELDKRSTDSLTTHNYLGNNINDQQELSSEKLQDFKKNILITGMKNDNTLDVSSTLTQKHAISRTVEKKPCLNFSVDVDRSHSLFSDTNENICPSLCQANAVNTIEASIICISDGTKKELDNEICTNSIKLGRKSISSTNSSKIETYNEAKEDLCEILSPVKAKIAKASISDIKFKLSTGKDNTHNDVDLEIKTLVSNNNVLGTNDSFVNNDKICNTTESCVVLSQLQDPIRVTSKRKRYHTWELDLTSISEDCIESKQGRIRPKRTNKGRKTKIQCLKSIREMPINNTSERIENVIYLKPGKSWARSLTILNSVQCKSNLETLSIGKGKNWRHSVQDILNMQKQGVIQSCIRKNGNDDEVQASNEIINKPEQVLANNKGRTGDSISLGRLSRRISVRVVPINKTVKSIEDAPFLEAYGIIPVKGKRVSLICNPQKSSLCNIQNDDVDGHIIQDHVSTAKEVILERCLQKDYIPFSTHFSDLYLEHCRKIGEGVYGEVFLYEHENKKSVIKIIPIEGSEFVNGEPQKKFHEILSEIVIAMELHNLRFNKTYKTDGFVEVKNVKCIKGKYPEKLVELWNIYDEEKRSDNDCPSMFNDDQLYIALELCHGGQDLEAFVFNTAEEAYILFIQAALALAVAEKAVEFEHRDLHWGNILISRTNESHVYYQLGPQKIALISKGVKVSIIDFTLSRVTYQGCSVFNDLASDPALFTAQGEYQFEIYRLMRDKIKNNWKKFEPYTNILWLHYTLDKMITAVRYRRKNLKIHKNGLVKLEELKNEILTYGSAFNFVTKCDKIVSLLCTDIQSELA